MTQNQQDQLKRLLKLAELSQEFEHLDIKLVDQWCSLREELGLAKLLLLIETYVKSKNQVVTSTSQTTNPNQDPALVQQL